MGKLFILKIGTTYRDIARAHGDFDNWTVRGLRLNGHDVRVVDIEHGAGLPSYYDCAGVVITGSHPNVTEDLPWSTATERWLPEIVRREIPVLGICYGHQLLARAMGGEVGFHPRGKEIGTVDVDLLPAAGTDPLFQGMPSRFSAQASHAQTVLVAAPGAVALAANEHEPTHSFRIGSSAWGVQFHPEFTAEITRSYIEERATQLRDTGFDVAYLLGAVRETPNAAKILARFAQIVEQGVSHDV